MPDIYHSVCFYLNSVDNNEFCGLFFSLFLQKNEPASDMFSFSSVTFVNGRALWALSISLVVRIVLGISATLHKHFQYIFKLIVINNVCMHKSRQV